MRIAIDATELKPGAIGGVRTALYLLLDALHKYTPDLQITAVAPHPVDVPRGVRTLDTGGPARPWRWRRSRVLHEALGEFDLFHSPVTAFPVVNGLVVTATVHELPFVVDHRLEGTRRALSQWYWLSRAMGYCAALVAPSQATLRQIRLTHPAAERITHVVPHPAPPTPSSEQKRHDGSVLFVGRLERRKCIKALLAGAACSEGQIRLVGPHTEAARFRIEKEAERLGLQDRVLIVGPVDADSLDFLYRTACVVGLVSASEGFGFPVLEALARGVPVIVAQDTGAAEVGGDAVQVVDTTHTEQIAAAIRRAVDPEYRHEVAVLGPARVLQFTPERTASGYAKVFERALGD
ncbi:MAG: glycosyltransferase [Planctomycetota bacterium]